MRWVRTRVLPEPAPASTSSGPSPWRTASRCGSLSSASSRSARSVPASVGAGAWPAAPFSGVLNSVWRATAPSIARRSAGPSLRLDAGFDRFFDRFGEAFEDRFFELFVGVFAQFFEHAFAQFGVAAFFQPLFERGEDALPVEDDEFLDLVELPVAVLFDQADVDRLTVEVAALEGRVGCRRGAVDFYLRHLDRVGIPLGVLGVFFALFERFLPFGAFD